MIRYAVCTNITPTGATIDRILSPAEMLAEVDALSADERVLAIGAESSHEVGQQVSARLDHYVYDIDEHVACHAPGS